MFSPHFQSRSLLCRADEADGKRENERGALHRKGALIRPTPPAIAVGQGVCRGGWATGRSSLVKYSPAVRWSRNDLAIQLGRSNTVSPAFSVTPRVRALK